jgi:hypothetical protein
MVAMSSLIHEHNGRRMSVHWGSTKGRSANVTRNRVSGHDRLYKDYFHHTDPIYNEVMSRCRYQMSLNPFLIILRGIKDYNPYFQCRADATGKLAFTS